jgi:hypothetical protein
VYAGFVLDGVHRLVLRSVAQGDDDPASPALDNLIAAGLVERSGGSFRITPAGEAALAAGERKPWEKWALGIVAAGVVLLAIGELFG